jgi:hypothetical protein
MFNRKSFGFAVILLIGAGQIAAHADEASHRQAVEQLFELTAMQQKIDESVANVLALQIAQNPGLEPHQDVVREFLERHIGWGSLKDALSSMYMQEFTEQEMDTMNSFYSSPTGRKVIERLPVLVQMRNQVASQRLQENIGELEYEINARQKQQERAQHP